MQGNPICPPSAVYYQLFFSTGTAIEYYIVEITRKLFLKIINYKNMFTNHSNTKKSTLTKTVIVPMLALVFGGLAWASFFYNNDSTASDIYSEKINRTYQVNWKTTSRMNVEDHNVYTPFPLATAMRTELEGLETVAQVQLFGKGFLQTGNKPALRLNELAFAEPQLLDIFEFKAMKGNLKGTLSSPNQVALSQSTAKRLFGSANPIGQVIHFNNDIDLTVTSVFAEAEAGTYATAQALISFRTLTAEILGEFPMDSWTDERKAQTYVVLEKNQTTSSINGGLEKIARQYTHKTSRLSAENTFVLQAFKDIYQAPKTLLNRLITMK